MPNSNNALRFFELLYGKLTEGYIGLFFLKRPARRESMQVLVTEHESIARIAGEKSEQGFDCYFSPALLKEPPPQGKRGDKSYYFGSSVLWADIDVKPERSKAQIFHTLEQFTPSPTAVVDSGNGAHVYWLLDQFETDVDAIESRNLWLAEQLGGDRVQSIDHLLRVPSTLNYKGVVSRV